VKRASHHRAFLASATVALTAFSIAVPLHAQALLQGNLPQAGRPGKVEFPNAPKGPLYRPSGLAKALDRAAADATRNRRGGAEVALFRNVAPSVVLLLNPDSLGSGSVIAADGQILTNWHVVGDQGDVAVYFQPAPGVPLKEAKFIIAEVVRVDQVADLALLQLREQLPATAKPIPLAPFGSVTVGDDVHAIGHPTGEAWSYTKGYVSQIRPRYMWNDEDGFKHLADVIQTQTPISPGSSGGPLLNNAGQLVGVNSFGTSDSQNLNFAVSAVDVRVFLQRATNRLAERVCQGKIVFEGRNKEDNGVIKRFDENCDGKADYTLLRPDNRNAPVYVLVDANNDEKTDGMILDNGRDGKWDISYWDEDFDGKPDLIGHHPNGEAEPSSYSKYTE
jgi:S1-C subfamily serine protease